MNSNDHTRLRLAVLAAIDAGRKDKIDKLGAFLDALHANGFRLEPLPPAQGIDPATGDVAHGVRAAVAGHLGASKAAAE
jgi:hypothetical protein